MAKYLVETYYTCSFKVSHYLDDVNEKNLQNLEKNEDGKFEILDVKLDNRKTKNLEKIDIEISKIRKKLGDISFMNNAPEEIVKEQKEREKEYQLTKDKIIRTITSFK